MTTAGRDGASETPRSAGVAWIAFGLVLALFCGFQDGYFSVKVFSHLRGSGVVAPTTDPRGPGGQTDAGAALIPSPHDGPGQNLIKGLVPGSPLYNAGAREGDLVAFDHGYDSGRALTVGETLGVAITHDGQVWHATVTAVQTPWQSAEAPDDLGEVILDLILFSSVLTGVFILLRSQGRTTFLLLGFAFICFANRGSNPDFPTGAESYPAWAMLCVVILRAMPTLFLAFAVAFHEETTGRTWMGLRLAAGAFGALTFAAGCAYSYANQSDVLMPVLGNGLKFYVWLYFIDLVAIVAIFVMGLRRAEQQTRRRYVLMLIAIVMVMLARGTGWIGVLLNARNVYAHFVLEFDNPIEIVTAVLALVGPLLFAYAALRNKVLDLGFVVNRTLVYGVLSFVILLAFGLVEWGVEKLLPVSFFAGHSEQIKMLVEAGIALTIFLVFHRVRDFVEKLVESVFFRAWHHNEAVMKRFVEQASFFTQSAPLIAGFTAELKRFGEGSDCALYQHDGDGGFVRVAGALKGAPRHIDGNDPVMVEARAERRRIDLDGLHSALPAVLALPMVHRAEVFGIVLMGAKPSGDDYRPDEKDLLGWAAHQVGLDLHALQVEALQARVSDLTGEVRALRSVVTPREATT